MKWTGILVSIVILACVSPLAAAEGDKNSNDADKQEAGKGGPFGFAGAIGAAAINDITYTQILLQPDLDFGSWGISLDVNLEFDKDGNPRPGEWDSWQAWLNKVNAFWIGSKGETFYLRLGTLENARLGHATIVNDFANNTFYPEIRMTGAQLDIDFGVFGFESMVENVLDYDILAGRIYFRPLRSTALFKELHIGATYAVDFDNKNPVTSGDNKYDYGDAEASLTAIGVYGADIGLPLPSLGILEWMIFADYVEIQNRGHGITYGLEGQLLGIFDWRFEYNDFSSEYAPGYFDSFYLAERSVKYDALMSITEGYKGYRFYLGRNFSIKAPDDLSIGLELSGAEGEHADMIAWVKAKPELLFDKIDFVFEYTKKDIEDLNEAFTPRDLDTMMKFRFGYMIADNVLLSLEMTKSFVVDTSGTVDQIVGQNSTTIQTQLRF